MAKHSNLVTEVDGKFILNGLGSLEVQSAKICCLVHSEKICFKNLLLS